jgi:hypothetical protein
VAKVLLDDAQVGAAVAQHEPGAMAEHMRVNPQLGEPGCVGSACQHLGKPGPDLGKPGPGARPCTLGHKHVTGARRRLALQPAQRPNLDAAEGVHAAVAALRAPDMQLTFVERHLVLQRRPTSSLTRNPCLKASKIIVSSAEASARLQALSPDQRRRLSSNLLLFVAGLMSDEALVVYTA